MSEKDTPKSRLIRVDVLDSRSCSCYRGGESLFFRWPLVAPENASPVCSRFLAGLVPLMDTLVAGDEPEGYKRVGDAWLVRCETGGASCKVAVRVSLEADTSRTGRLTVRGSSRLAQELASLPVFEDLDPLTLSEIAAAAKTRVLPEGRPLLKEGEKGTRLFVILRGTAAVLGKDEDDADHCLALLGRGDVVGEMSLISGAPASATVVAQGDCTVVEIPKAEFLRLMNEKAGFAMYFARLLCERLRSSNRQFIALLEHGVTGKLSTVTLPELCQIIKLNNRSGIVRLSCGERTGLIYFRDGEIYNAITGGLSGEKAFYALLEWEEGDFRFEGGVFDGDREIHADVMALILEAMRQRDESSR